MKETKQINLNEDTVKNYPLDGRFAVIEACLFAAGHPLTYGKLGEVLNITPSECCDTVEKMAALYNNDVSVPRGVMLVRFPDSCQLCTKEIYGKEIKLALGMRRGGNLSQSLLEVLAVVAYNQPSTRAFVDAVRGVDSSYAIGALLEKELIEQYGRLDAPGRPSLYRTTTTFLRVFGLSELSELPSVRLHNDSGEVVNVTPDLSPITEQIALGDAIQTAESDDEAGVSAASDEDRDELIKSASL